jgi:hypothetical protein
MSFPRLSGPVEVRLTQNPVSVSCTVTYDDGSTDELPITALRMRRAQLEVTGLLKAGHNNYEPVERWIPDIDNPASFTRRFRCLPQEAVTPPEESS